MMLSGIVSAGHSFAAQPSLVCDVGPLTKTFGNAHWLVFSCNDERTVIVVAAPDNPATPFYFVLYPSESGYELGGEGTGDRDYTAAAHRELQTLKPTEIADLIQETKQR